MVCVLTQQSASQRKMIHLPSDDEIRSMILYQKECLLHIPTDPDEYKIGNKFIDVPDDERRGIIKALRWIIEDYEDIFQR